MERGVQAKGRRAVVVGCARDSGAHLPAVLKNCERLASAYDHAEFVFVENDSRDQTKTLLKDWLAAGRSGKLLDLDGLAGQKLKRTARIAAARNAYLDEIRNGRLSEFDHLVILDMDNVNAGPIDAGAFRAAIDFLDSAPERAGVFANAEPLYYDIWALRQDRWCPRDCWTEITQRPWWMSKSAAAYRYIYSRQLKLPMALPPLRVSSAFGGLGVYKLSFALDQCYSGFGADGEMACEHVAFNEAICKNGGKLYIFPQLQNRAPMEHTIWGRRWTLKKAYFMWRHWLRKPSFSEYGI